MNTDRPHRTRLIGAMAAIAATSLAFGVPAAHADDTQPGNGASRRAEQACARVPDLQVRVQRAVDRLLGAPTARGSLAWLEAQIGRATAAGRDDAVTVLQNRLEVRTAHLDLLQLRLAKLAELQQLCADRGVGA